MRVLLTVAQLLPEGYNQTVQISIQRDTYQGHANSPWLVVVPRRLSATGKRQYKRFSTRAAASSFVSQLTASVKQHGEHPMEAITGAAATDAKHAASLLEGTGLTLTAAAQLIVTLLQRQGSVANLLSAGGEGRGEQGEAAAAAPLPRSRADGTHAISVADAVAALNASKAHQAATTVANRATRFRTLLRRNRGLAATPLASLTAPQITEALNRAWPSAPVSWNDCHKQLCALYTFALRKGYCTASPMAAIDPRHDVEEAEITALRPHELRALFAACRHATAEERASAAGADAYTRRCIVQDCTALRPYIALCAFAGVRPAECARLRWCDVGWEDAVISVRSAQSKTGGTRHIELHPALAAWLRACRPAAAADTDLITPAANLKWRLRCIRRRAGYNEQNPWQDDVLRHSYATYYLKAGGELPRLMLNMGHSSTRLLYTRYTNMAGITRAMAAAWWQIMPEGA